MCPQKMYKTLERKEAHFLEMLEAPSFLKINSPTGMSQTLCQD